MILYYINNLSYLHKHKMSSAAFKCPACQRKYKRQNYYDRHVLLCKLLDQVKKTKKERDQQDEERADTPTLRDLYIVVMELATKYTHLEEKMNEMAKWVNTKKQKLKITDWLNSNYKEAVTYTDWLATITFTRANLEFIFNADYITGMGLTLQHLYNAMTTTPFMHAFTAKENGLYIYNPVEQWHVMSEKEFLQLMHLLDKKSMTEFVKWQTENKAKMHLDDFTIKYALNVKKIMGNNIPREQLYARVRRELFKYIRRDPPNIMEMEMEFSA